MAELRWVLLLAGLLFLLSLATWELRRARRARRLERADGQRRAFEHNDTARVGSEGRQREPATDCDTTLADPSMARADSGTVDEQQLETEPAAPPPAPNRTTRIEPTLIESALTDPALTDPALTEPLMDSSAPISATAPLRVEWPEEGERRIFAVRIVAPSGERLAGRMVRQALGACGFVHGPYRIYHQPAADGRSLLSCANLTKPGDFDPLTLDFQRLIGLSMFSILPGPLPPAAALEHLLETADELAQRLQAELADERGAPLDAARVAGLRAAAQQWTLAGTEAPGAESTRGA